MISPEETDITRDCRARLNWWTIEHCWFFDDDHILSERLIATPYSHTHTTTAYNDGHPAIVTMRNPRADKHFGSDGPG